MNKNKPLFIEKPIPIILQSSIIIGSIQHSNTHSTACTFSVFYLYYIIQIHLITRVTLDLCKNMCFIISLFLIYKKNNKKTHHEIVTWPGLHLDHTSNLNTWLQKTKILREFLNDFELKTGMKWEIVCFSSW